MNTVAIVGVGLIGASFALALRKNGFTGDLIGVSSPAALQSGREVGAITGAATLEEAAAAADLIYLAQPVDRILVTIEKLAGLVREGSLVTDAGSTKAAIVAKAAAFLPPDQFLGGHPMAGKEQRGAEAANADLFRNRPYVLTPHSGESPASRDFRSWLPRIGANVIDLSAKEHDATVALTSHLPQILSTALALTLARKQSDYSSKVFGQGLLDMTRLAMSTPELWLSILNTNKEEVASALNAYSRTLSDLHNALGSDTLMELFEAGAGWAKQVRDKNAET
ncbi:MAG: prephenate dehydrogenase/arogenate dehydrogenase family protein [Acidobacteriota bacterium]|nr:prephenate dehydrogenase/arogenate dehydrogenase family protein [Acidobacteriota bacterium]